MTFCHSVFLRYMPTPWNDPYEVDREIVSEFSKDPKSRIKFMEWLRDLSEPSFKDFVCSHSMISQRVVKLLSDEEKATFPQTAERVKEIVKWRGEHSSVFWDISEREALPPNWQLPAQEERLIAHLKANKEDLKRIVDGLKCAALYFVPEYPQVAAHVVKVAPRDLKKARWIMQGLDGTIKQARCEVFLAYAECGFCDRVQQMVQEGVTRDEVEEALIAAINRDFCDEKQRRKTVYYLMSLLGSDKGIEYKAFRRAVAIKDLELIKFFKEKNGIDVNEKDPEGTTALMVAASSGAYISVDLLLNVYHANPNAQDAQGRTALMYAISEPVFCLETLRRLVYNVNPLLKNAQGKTALELLQSRIKDRDGYVDDLRQASWILEERVKSCKLGVVLNSLFDDLLALKIDVEN